MKPAEKWNAPLRCVAVVVTGFILLLGSLLMTPGRASANEAAGSASATLQSDSQITRAEWLHMLVEATGYEVDSGVYPDNYYSDLSSDHEYYDDILTAVDAGMVDVAVGGELKPDDPASREFIAHTSNVHAGYVLDEDSSYTFSDSGDAAYPDDCQVAVNRGWFALQSGKFSPSAAATQDEANSIIADIKAIDEAAATGDHANTWTLAAGVVEVPSGTQVSIDEDSTVTVESCPVSIAQGDVFVVFPQENMPLAYRAESVSVSGSVTTVTTSSVEASEAFSALDVEVEETPGEEQFSASDEVAYATEAELADAAAIADEETAELLASGSAGLNINTLHKELSFGSAKVGVTAAFSDVKLVYKSSLSSGRYMAKVVGNANVVLSGSGEGSEKFTYGTYYFAYGMGSATVSQTFTVSGEVAFSQGYHFVVGAQYARGAGVQSLSKVTKKGAPTITGKVGVDVNLRVDASIKVPQVASGSLYASVGADSSVEFAKYGDGKPTTCITMAMYLYAKVGAKVTFLGHDVCKYDYSIWDVKRSPVKVVEHWEDDVLVSSCSRGKSIAWGDLCSYFTWGGSPFYGGDGGNVSSKGTNAAGEAYTYWEYSLSDTKEATITKCNTNCSTIMVPSSIDGYTVVGIASGAFQSNDGISVVVIPEGVTTVNGFSGCEGLTYVSLPSTVETIEGSAFSGCTSLASMTFNDGLTSIGPSAFKGCTSLQAIVLPETLVSLDTRSFGNCTALASVYIPVSMQSWGGVYSSSYYPGPFSGCTALKTVTFGEGTTKIANSIMQDATGLEEVVIPEGVTEIGRAAFNRCVNLKKVDFPSTLETIGGGDVVNGDGAFANCTSLENVDFPDGLISIGWSAFQDCDSLTKVYLPDTVVELGRATFGWCDNLAEVRIPAALQDWGGVYYGRAYYGPFYGCSSLKSVTFGEGIKKIPTTIFWGTTGLEEISIPEGVTDICYAAFSGCSNLKTVNFPSTLKNIADRAFYECASLENVAFNEGLQSIGVYTFGSCESLTSVSLPDTVTYVGDDAFNSCTGVTSLKLSRGLTSIGSSFCYCTALTEVDVPETLKTLGGYTFASCSNLAKVTLHEGLTKLGNGVFRDCASLDNVTLPSTLTTIGKIAFQNCKSLTSVDIPDSVTSMGTYVFDGCSKLASVKLPIKRINISEGMFQSCTSLTSITLPRNVANINANAFAKCTKLTSITVPRGLASVDSTAFSYPTRMTMYGVAGTYAETYADDAGMKFVDTPVKATKVTVSTNTLDLGNSWSAELSLVIEPVDCNEEIVWSSSNEDVATVKATSGSGDVAKVSRVGYGSATITATVGDVTAACEVSIPKVVQRIYLDKSSLSLKAGETYQLVTTISPDDATNKAVTWSSTDDAVATVGDAGLVTAVAAGEAKVTATAADGSGASRSCSVTVTAAEAAKPDVSESVIIDIPEQTYNGLAVEPEVTVTFGGKMLVKDVDYTVTYSNNVDAGTATVTITGIGSYVGSKTATFQIVNRGETHTHSWGSWLNDANGHWKICSCGEKSQQGSHTWGEWKTTKPATATAAGSRERACTVCGYKAAEASPATGGSDSSEPVDTVKMHRLYNPNSGEHFYTASAEERDGLVSLGWTYEGVGWTAPSSSGTPVYRLYNEYGGEHHYTTSEAEKDSLVKAGWKYEGIGWYSDDAKTVPLYRQYNPNAFANNHNYTASKDENDWLVGLGWRAEGVGWYGV